MFWSKPKCKGAAEASKHPTTTTISTTNNIASAPPPPPGHRRKKQPPIMSLNNDKWPDKRPKNSQSFPSPKQCTVTEQASSMALAGFQYQIIHHNIPYWGPGSVEWIQDSPDGELQDVPIRTQPTLPILPLCVLYPVFTLCQLTHHKCI